MADASYVVQIKWEIEDLQSRLSAFQSKFSGGGDPFKKHAEGMKGALAEVGGAAKEIGGHLADAFTGAVEKAGELAMTVAKIGGAAALGAVVYGVAGLNDQLEQTGVSLAAIFAMQGFGTFAESTTIAADQLAKMKQDVKALPGDLGQLSAIMTTIATPAAQGGADPDKIRELAGRSMLVGRILQVPPEVVAREMANLLAGRAGAHNILGSRLGFVGDEAKRFNAESSAQRLQELTGKFFSPQMADAAKAFAGTWVAQTTTLKDNVKYALLAPATSPLFESVKRALGDVNDWFDRNKDKVAAWARVVGDRLAEAFERGEAVFLRWLPSIEAFAEHAYAKISSIWTRLEPILASVGEAARKALGSPEALDRVEDVLKLYAAVKAGGALLGAAAPVGKLLGAGMGLGGAGEAGGLLGAAASPEGAIALGTAIAAMLPVAFAGAGAVYDLTNATSKYHEEASAFAKDAGSALSNALDSLKSATITLTPAIEELAGRAGKDLLLWLDSAARMANVAAGTFNDLASMLARLGILPEGQHREAEEKEHPMKVLLDDFQVYKDRLGGKGDKPKVPANGATVHVANVEITISGNQDPSRIARITKQHLQEMARFATSSPHLPNPLAGRQR